MSEDILFTGVNDDDQQIISEGANHIIVQRDRATIEMTLLNQMEDGGIDALTVKSIRVGGKEKRMDSMVVAHTSSIMNVEGLNMAYSFGSFKGRSAQGQFLHKHSIPGKCHSLKEGSSLADLVGKELVEEPVGKAMEQFQTLVREHNVLDVPLAQKQALLKPLIDALVEREKPILGRG